jgi:hypothetical protein
MTNDINQPDNEEDSWAWLDVYTKSKDDWVFRKRVPRSHGQGFNEMRSSIARSLSQSPAVPMSFSDFKLVKRP